MQAVKATTNLFEHDINVGLKTAPTAGKTVMCLCIFYPEALSYSGAILPCCEKHIPIHQQNGMDVK